MLTFLCSFEFKEKHADWLNLNKTVVGSGISTELDGSLNADNELIQHCYAVRNEARLAMDAFLGVSIMLTFFFGSWEYWS